MGASVWNRAEFYLDCANKALWLFFPHSIERSLCMEVKFKIGCSDVYFFTSLPYFCLLCHILLQTIEILPRGASADAMGKNISFEIFYAFDSVVVDANNGCQFSFGHV